MDYRDSCCNLEFNGSIKGLDDLIILEALAKLYLRGDRTPGNTSCKEAAGNKCTLKGAIPMSFQNGKSVRVHRFLPFRRYELHI